MTESTAPAAQADVEALAYDDAFAELQRVVAELEAGGETLEATIALYERAVALQRRCERLLAEAELRVQQLMAAPGGALAVVDVRPRTPRRSRRSAAASPARESDPATIRYHIYRRSIRLETIRRRLTGEGSQTHHHEAAPVVRAGASPEHQEPEPVPILDRLQDPADLRGLSDPELDQLAAEIRETIIRTVAATGGHLGSSLGVVEVTLALHRLLESPRDRIVWDTGHQAYAHKLLTGPPRALPHAAPDRRHRRVPAPQRVAARRHGRRPRRHRPVHRPGPRDRARPAPLDGADRRRRRATRRCCPASRSRRSTTSATARRSC